MKVFSEFASFWQEKILFGKIRQSIAKRNDVFCLLKIVNAYFKIIIKFRILFSIKTLNKDKYEQVR